MRITRTLWVTSIAIAARRLSPLLVTAMPVVSNVAEAQAAPPGFRSEFLHQFNESMAKVVALAEALPADAYARRPAPGVMPIGQLFSHMARFNYEYPARDMGISPPRDIDRDTLERVTRKPQVIALLRRSADHVRQSVRSTPDAQLERMTTLYGRRVPQWAVLFHLIAHLDNHMGQSIAYARVLGIVPPWSH